MRNIPHCGKRRALDEIERPHEVLHVGMDFNVLNMTGIISVIRDGNPYTVAELTGVRDTPAITKIIEERYQEAGHQIIVYPDASG